MNPTALIVLCLCGMSTVSLVPFVRNSPSGLILLIFPIVWAIAACSLSAIALAGEKKTEVGTVLLVLLVLLVAYMIRVWFGRRKSESPKPKKHDAA